MEIHHPIALERQKGLGDVRILLVPREMIHNTDKDLQVWKSCLEAMGEGSEKEGREGGITGSPWYPTVASSIQ